MIFDHFDAVQELNILKDSLAVFQIIIGGVYCDCEERKAQVSLAIAKVQELYDELEENIRFIRGLFKYHWTLVRISRLPDADQKLVERYGEERVHDEVSLRGVVSSFFNWRVGFLLDQVQSLVPVEQVRLAARQVKLIFADEDDFDDYPEPEMEE